MYNPLTQTVNCIKSYETRDAEEALTQHRAYHAELKSNNYNITPPPPKKADERPQLIFLKEGAKKYLDFLQDIDTPEYEKKNLTMHYIKDQKRYIMRFLQTVQQVEKKLSNFPVTSISRPHVAAFDKYVRSLNLSQTSYNGHMKAVKYFVNYLIDELRSDMRNPFDKVKFPEIHYDPEIIPVEEFEQLLSFITLENGIGTKGKKKKETVNYYRDWLKKVFIFSLLTGERLDGIVLLQWKHVEGNFLRIPNWKVNRIQKASHYYSYTPITADLAELLLEFPVTNPEDYIVVPQLKGRASLKLFISKAFTHFWKKAGLTRKVTFKNLRKTYITRLTAIIGEKALYVKHNEDKTAVKHYLQKKELLDATKDVRLYETFL
ncbi:MAG: hypothetical protein DI538_20745 [Azospira oryzae]|nr:MAG: hypothetical protein DI538_20745 [Azospira oryzae]